ncbi:T9SS type A sorting domain-containing protein [Sediminibacterium sp.]|uniref:T9SS type A sorting domain-containing protein n=1 Tax=Sediminibacterium sp. TaxID=1917865 RepID=UPI0027347D54|nr:T9SS type A sorting domain-containing protein [Sediminibacterium sp.]MDP3394924.1 T9SS type A sorting domain-containing protein [Sediminibacterium sp.]MDP3565550.1 T9SS type A sorting domain-containing protein [Sediminibacterium sp.]
MRPHIIILLLLLQVADSSVYAQLASPIIYSEKKAIYQQNFNDLPNGGSFTLTGKGPHTFSQSPFLLSGLTGWEFMHKSGSGTNAVFAQGTGTATSSGMYSVGTSGSSDRALGSVAAGSGVYAFGILLTNQTGSSLNTISGSFSAEQWRKGGSGNKNTWLGKYATGLMNSIDQPNLLAHTSMNFSSIQFTTGAGSLNGNSSENQTTIQFSIIGIEWKNGEQLLLRWDDADETGSDDLVAIDNFSFSADFDTSNNTVTIDSLYALAPQLSNADTIQYSFKAGGDISGLSTSNFALITEGLTNAAITSISGTGNEYLIHVYTGIGEGKLVLGINNNNNLIPGLSGLPFFSIDTQWIDKIKPHQIDFSSPNDSLLKAGDTLQLKLLFSESVYLDSNSSIKYLPITIGGNNRQAAYYDGNNSNQLLFKYIIQEGEKDKDGIGIANNFNPNQLIIKDQAENLATINLLSSVIQYIQVDGTRIQFQVPTDTMLIQCNNKDSIDIGVLLAIDTTVAGEEINWQIVQAPTHWFSSLQNFSTVSNGSITSPGQWKVHSQYSLAKDSILVRVSNGITSANKKIILQSLSWIGNVDSNWNNPHNWCNTLVPSDSAVITISADALHQPILSGVNSIKQLHLLSRAKLQITGTLKISDIMSGDSLSIDATNATIELNGNNSQIINGALFKENRIQQVVLKNTTGAQINHRLIINGSLQLAAGNLFTNDLLYLSETASIDASAAGTQIIGRVHAANILGNKAVGSYLVGHPFNQSISFYAWTNKPTIFYNNPLLNTDSCSIETGWQAVNFSSDSASNDFKKHQGIRWNILPNQASNLWPAYFTGSIQMGTQQIVLNKTGNGFNLIANPYLSPVNTGTFNRSAKVSAYKYIWNPLLGSKGGYMALPFTQKHILNPFEAYILLTDSSAANEITITEASKSTEWNKGLSEDYQEGSGYYSTIDLMSNQTLHDRFIIREQSGARNGKDSLDAIKLMNPGLNIFSKISDGIKLAIDSRLFQQQTIIPIELTNAVEGNYRFQIFDAFMPTAFKLVLYDNYTHKTLSLLKDSSYAFNITSDTLSKAPNRFYIGKFVPQASSPLVNLLTVKIYPNPAKNELKVIFKSAVTANSSIRLYHLSGTLVKTIQVGSMQQGLVSIPIGDISNGQYYIQVISGTNQQNIPFIKQ